MKIAGDRHEPATGIIRHRTTNEYYKGGGRWTADLKQAREFENLFEVVDEAHRYGIKDCCEFILRLAGFPGLSVFLPL
jgi:hypothetical protein